MVKKSKILILYVFLAFTGISCATIVSGSKQDIRLNSSPAGAKVIINGKDVGMTTPCLVKLKRKVRPSPFNNRNEYHYAFEKEGYTVAEYSDYRRINPKLYLNTFTWLFITISLPIDFITGAAYKYNDYVQVNLYPLQNNQNKEVTNVDKPIEEDKQPPVIKIYKPDLERGFKQTVMDETYRVSGIAIDPSGIYEVSINNVPANVADDGSFEAEITLNQGNNKVSIVARDKKMNTTIENFYLERKSEISQASDYEADIENGNYFALIIGVQDYLDPSFADLDEPFSDAQKLYKALTTHYQFDSLNFRILKNPGRDEITQALEDYFNQLTSKDNLLIFYAGHGYWDEKFNQGYWLPSDARYNNRGTWLSNSTIRDYMRAIPCKHSLLITDACFSGGIFKSREAFPDASKAINELYKLPSRKAMTSGALNQVPDKSVFLHYLIKRLEENEQKYLSAEQLFASFKLAVINNSPQNQVPQFGEVKETGDEGGDFIFVKK